MKTLYHTTVTHIGNEALDSLIEDRLITFMEGAPESILNYCVIHTHDTLLCAIKPTDILLLGDKTYPITAVGTVANHNLEALGHITFCFDSALDAAYPGCIHLSGPPPKTVSVGMRITFLQG